MFDKIVGVEAISLLPQAKEDLKKYAKEVVLYNDKPSSDEEIIARIGDADAMLVSYTTNISGEVIKKCPNLKYIGMCCSLYSIESANVDIKTAQENGITVLGIRDYGDEGVVEFVISELVQLLHGFGSRMWDEAPRELTGLKFGVIGLGTSGKMVGNGMKALGSDVYYYSRTRKPEAESEGYTYLELQELLRTCEVVCTCLNKNTVLLFDEELQAFGNHKILINTGLSPACDMEAFEKWIDGDNYFICDTHMALANEKLEAHKNVRCVGQSSGMTKQAYHRLSQKVLENIETALEIYQ